jgi:membrane protease YdiL (CAAX protease family)
VLALVLWIAGFDRDLLALHRPRSWGRALGLALVLFVGVYAAIALMDPLLHASREQGLTPERWEPAHAGAYVLNGVVVAGVAPIVEETTFRGLGFSLLRRFGLWIAVLGVGVAFGLAHGLVNGLPELVLFGSALAWLRARVESVYPGMLVHGTFNGISLVAAVVHPH